MPILSMQISFRILLSSALPLIFFTGCEKREDGRYSDLSGRSTSRPASSRSENISLPLTDSESKNEKASFKSLVENKAGEFDVESARNQIKGLAGKELKDAWCVVRDSGLSVGRIQYVLGASIFDLGQRGESDDALVLVNSLFGEGDLRKALVGYCFEYIGEGFQKLPSMIGLLSEDQEKMYAQRGLASAIAYSKDFSVVDVSLLEGFDVEQVLNDAFSMRLRASSSKRRSSIFKDALEFFGQLDESSGWKEESYQKFYLKVANTIPFEVWNSILERREMYSFQDKEVVLRGMIRESALRSINLLVEGEDPIVVGLGFKAWMATDSGAANRWYVENLDSLSDQQVAQIASARSLHEIENGGFSAARTVLGSIRDESLRAEIEESLQVAEKNSVRELARKDPAKTVSDLASGDGSVSPVFLEDALSVWIYTDGEAAARWMESEGADLPPETRQYAAIPYAYEAARQGDLELARQWANQVVDEDAKTRVMEMLSRAEDSSRN